MGFVVNKQVNFPGGINIDNFYVRIESYQLHKSVGQLDLCMGHYVDKKGAVQALPPYFEDIPKNDGSFRIPHELNIEGKQIAIPYILSFALSGSSPTKVEEWEYSNEWKVVEEEVIDYNDDGEEVKSFDTKKIKVEVSSSKMVEKTVVYNHDFKKENLIEFAYSKVKDIYNKEFGSDNIKDLI
jgi:hypothetical protein|tara:strand:+ start:409 stop:957 length:549 start_codon:yes stop_codon:yes gene_type:complete